MRTDRHQIHLAGADKLALVLAAIVLTITVLFWAMVVVAAGIGGANHVLASTGLSWVEDGLSAIALLWGFLRAIRYTRRSMARASFSRAAKARDGHRRLSTGNDLAARHF